MEKKIRKSDADWHELLTPDQYDICRKKGTEPAFSGKLLDCKENGIYCCVCCENELFSSKTKYESGSGWPSFWKTIDATHINENKDLNHGMLRIEITCSCCGAHLGHVFDDGPNPTGKRYCINSVSLKFNPNDQGAKSANKKSTTIG